MPVLTLLTLPPRSFFINLDDNDFLDHTAKTNQGWGYAVFGKVTAGMDVVNNIGKAMTGSRKGHDDVPLDTIKIEKKVTVKSE
ncbi:peptidylprolyl isomerase [Vibrio sinaloensis]|nr:peptidylprolyl isomerase [Vibrio sinaloensis]